MILFLPSVSPVGFRVIQLKFGPRRFDSQ